MPTQKRKISERRREIETELERHQLVNEWMSCRVVLCVRPSEPTPTRSRWGALLKTQTRRPWASINYRWRNVHPEPGVSAPKHSGVKCFWWWCTSSGEWVKVSRSVETKIVDRETTPRRGVGNTSQKVKFYIWHYFFCLKMVESFYFFLVWMLNGWRVSPSALNVCEMSFKLQSRKSFFFGHFLRWFKMRWKKCCSMSDDVFLYSYNFKN